MKFQTIIEIGPKPLKDGQIRYMNSYSWADCSQKFKDKIKVKIIDSRERDCGPFGVVYCKILEGLYKGNNHYYLKSRFHKTGIID